MASMVTGFLRYFIVRFLSCRAFPTPRALRAQPPEAAEGVYDESRIGEDEVPADRDVIERVGEKGRRQQRQPDSEQPFAGSVPAPAHDDNLRHVAVTSQQGPGPRRRTQHELNKRVHSQLPGFKPPGSFPRPSLSPPPHATTTTP